MTCSTWRTWSLLGSSSALVLAFQACGRPWRGRTRPGRPAPSRARSRPTRRSTRRTTWAARASSPTSCPSSTRSWRSRWPCRAAGGAGAARPCSCFLVCAGFCAVHAVAASTSRWHHAMVGGWPRLRADASHESQISGRGLVFFGNDEAFNLAYDPRAEPSHEPTARQHNDDHDCSRPTTGWASPGLRLQDGDQRGDPRSTPSTSSRWQQRGLWRFESEADWLPLPRRRAGRAGLDERTCASGAR